MSFPGKLHLLKASMSHVEAISELLKKTYGDEISENQTNVEELTKRMSEGKCTFNIITGLSSKGIPIIGVACWYLHMPSKW